MNKFIPQRLTDQRAMPETGTGSERMNLAGSWSPWDAESLTAATAPLEQVDPDLWRE